MLRIFGKRRKIEDELKENPDQPDKWLELAKINEDKAPEALINALIYSKGDLLDEVVRVIRGQALQRRIEPLIDRVDSILGREYSSFLKGLVKEYKGNLKEARNFYDVARNSSNQLLNFLSNYYVGVINLKEGVYEVAYKILNSIKGNVPEVYRTEFEIRLRELESKLGLSGSSILKSFKEGLRKTRNALSFSSIYGRKIDEALFEEIEEKLILSDMGVKTTLALMDFLRNEVKRRKLKTSEELVPLIKERIRSMLAECEGELSLSGSPSVILVLGVNGVGKTTTIGKLAKQLIRSGKSVLFAAADTFRAAAIEQLQVWAERSGARIVLGKEGSDPASVVYDAIQSIKAKGEDVLIVDTAGRLHNKEKLMKEIQKIKKVISKELPGEPSEILLVLDANTGQNAISQAKAFKEITDVTGIALTKLDGTSKGGIVVAICNELKMPVKFVGIGERIEDLRKFNSKEFVDALFASD